jgi:aminopeptidase N
LRSKLPFLGFFCICLTLPCFAGAVVHHHIFVKLTPTSGELQVRDTMTLPPGDKPTSFTLNSGFTVNSADPGVRLEPVSGSPSSPATKLYRVTLPSDRSRFTINYQGKLAAPPGAVKGSQGNGSYLTADGAYLDAAGHWYPQFGDTLLTFSLEVQLPSSWKSISQGIEHLVADQKAHREHWKENHPQQEIYLLAAAYHEYRRSVDGVTASVFLRSDDPGLAERYLAVIPDYIRMYSRLLGPYPYDKFAVVENTWESGYGMPSFTLLGPRVMRFPFILRTSLPHEILHNWWGNGVYVDYAQGNWSEGLTAYLADHLLREQAGEGMRYRRNALLRYTNYVSSGNDFPLREFQGRHNEATQAVGYDKSLMVFDMLRGQLGDKPFLTALRHFYREQRFHVASWDDLRHAFEKVAGHSLHDEFDQWLNRRGAPLLHVGEARAQPSGDHYRLSLKLAQDQSGPAYRLHIPVAVQLGGWQRPWQTVVDLSQRQQTFNLAVPARPWRLEVDPQFDVFRRLAPGELPPTLSEALGADSLLIVLPAAAPSPLRDTYAELARAWAEQNTAIEVRWDKDVTRLPEGRAVWLMGWKNRFLPLLGRNLQRQASISTRAAKVNGRSLLRSQQAVVLTTRRGGSSGAVLMWLGCDNPAAFPGLARKLPHYGSYSYLAFQGDAPTNTLKGQWKVLDSPMYVTVKQEDNSTAPPGRIQLPPRQPLTTLINN